MPEYCDRHPGTELIYEGPDGFATCPDCVDGVDPCHERGCGRLGTERDGCNCVLELTPATHPDHRGRTE